MSLNFRVLRGGKGMLEIMFGVGCFGFLDVFGDLILWKYGDIVGWFDGDSYVCEVGIKYGIFFVGMKDI